MADLPTIAQGEGDLGTRMGRVNADWSNATASRC